jgi:hypothetical protein
LSERLPFQGCQALLLSAKNCTPVSEAGTLSVSTAELATPGPLLLTLTV